MKYIITKFRPNKSLDLLGVYDKLSDASCNMQYFISECEDMMSEVHDSAYFSIQVGSDNDPSYYSIYEIEGNKPINLNLYYHLNVG